MHHGVHKTVHQEVCLSEPTGEPTIFRPPYLVLMKSLKFLEQICSAGYPLKRSLNHATCISLFVKPQAFVPKAQSEYHRSSLPLHLKPLDLGEARYKSPYTLLGTNLTRTAFMYGSCQKSGAPIWTRNRKALLASTPTKRIPNLWEQNL